MKNLGKKWFQRRERKRLKNLEKPDFYHSYRGGSSVHLFSNKAGINDDYYATF